MNLKETYNKIANDWSDDHKNDDWWGDGTDKFVSLLKPGAEVLDVGCGDGVKSKYLREKGLKVTGIDFSEKLLEISKRESSGVSFYLMDMREVEKLGTQFDGVFAQASLLHIPKSEIVEVIGKLISVLNPDGYIYIAVKRVRPDRNEEGIIKENNYGYDYERFFSYYQMNELEDYLKKWNLKIVHQNIKTVGKIDWLQIIGHKG